jgi:tripartite-type tricarboxylate transporter receptor subunit TctC
MAPTATPQAIVDRLQAEIVRALDNPEVKQKLLVQGLEARSGSAVEFGKFIDDETGKWSTLIREAGLKGE